MPGLYGPYKFSTLLPIERSLLLPHVPQASCFLTSSHLNNDNSTYNFISLVFNNGSTIFDHEIAGTRAHEDAAPTKGKPHHRLFGSKTQASWKQKNFQQKLLDINMASFCPFRHGVDARWLVNGLGRWAHHRRKPKKSIPETLASQRCHNNNIGTYQDSSSRRCFLV